MILARNSSQLFRSNYKFQRCVGVVVIDWSLHFCKSSTCLHYGEYSICPCLLILVWIYVHVCDTRMDFIEIVADISIIINIIIYIAIESLTAKWKKYSFIRYRVISRMNTTLNAICLYCLTRRLNGTRSVVLL